MRNAPPTETMSARKGTNLPIYRPRFKFLKFFDVFNGYQGNIFNTSLTYYDVMLQFLFLHNVVAFSD